MPTFSSPMALSMPQSVSTIRGGGLPLDGCQGESLDDNGAQSVQIHIVGKLPGVAEGSRGGHHRILERQSADVDGQVR